MIKVQISGLTEKQYQRKYLNLCKKYDLVNQYNVTMSWVDGLYYGYLVCENV